jgi:prepilin-type N-terminal cleavage/methylation domain-containing protein
MPGYSRVCVILKIFHHFVTFITFSLDDSTFITGKKERQVNMRSGNERGFTMVELLIVVVVIGILATLAVPNTKNLFKKDNLRASTASVTSSLYLARMKAVNDGVVYGVKFNSNGTFAVMSDPKGSPAVRGSIYRLEKGITFGSNTFVNQMAIFNEYGQLDKTCLASGSMTGKVVIANAGVDSTQVEVTFISGRIRETNK